MINGNPNIFCDMLLVLAAIVLNFNEYFVHLSVVSIFGILSITGQKSFTLLNNFETLL